MMRYSNSEACTAFNLVPIDDNGDAILEGQIIRSYNGAMPA